MAAEGACDYELIIIGGGPAGLSAAIYAARKVLKALVLVKEQGGQLLLTREIENYPGIQKIGGFELAERLRKHAERYGVPVKLGVEVTAVERSGSGEGEEFVVKTDGESYTAKAVLIATGGRPRRLGVPGEKEFTGRGVSYCATCDAPLFRGKRVAMIGGGNAAFEGIIDLLPIATEIHVVDIADHWFADPILQAQVLNSGKVKTYQQHRVVEIKGREFVSSIVIESLQTGEQEELAVEGVFIEIGTVPNTDFVRDFVELNHRGEIVVDRRTFQTSVPGVFAAGDVVEGLDKQIVIAAAQGAQAALSAYRYLIETGKLEERELTTRAPRGGSGSESESEPESEEEGPRGLFLTP